MFHWLHEIFTKAAYSIERRDDSFDPARRGLRGDRILNYVWVEKTTKPEPVADDPLCSIPLHYLDKAYKNARLYPDTMVNVWIDYAALNMMSRFIFESHAHIKKPDNVILRNLDTIPRYKQNTIFAPRGLWDEDYIGIWRRADYARFIVLNHCLEVSPADRIFYSDFDINDVDLDNVKTDAVLTNKGMAFALLPDSLEMAHGYISVDRSAQTFLRGDLLPALEKGVYWDKLFTNMQRTLLLREYGPQGMGHAYKSGSVDEFLILYTTDVVVPPIGTVMNIPDLYLEEDLCGYEFR